MLIINFKDRSNFNTLIVFVINITLLNTVFLFCFQLYRQDPIYSSSTYIIAQFPLLHYKFLLMYFLTVLLITHGVFRCEEIYQLAYEFFIAIKKNKCATVDLCECW